MKYIIAGDSHGPTMTCILTGFPSGLNVDLELIKKDLHLRASVFGRSSRMKLERDNLDFLSGIYNGTTTGAPVTFTINNKSRGFSKRSRSIPRPGHGDYSAYTKYKIKDFNVYAERNSARWTVLLTVLGSLSRQVLNSFDIDVLGYLNGIGFVTLDKVFPYSLSLRTLRNNSRLLCPDKDITDKMIEKIETIKMDGDTIGGRVRIVSTNIPSGLGGYEETESKLDARISSILLSIPSVKGVLFGDEIYNGKEYVDYFTKEDSLVTRRTNRCGGIEAGFSNGMPLQISLFIKPIPTMRDGSESIDFDTMEYSKSPYIRSDITSAPAVSIISEAAVSFVLLDAILEKYGNGNIRDIKNRILNDEFKW
jgi:chorismate synthase